MEAATVTISRSRDLRKHVVNNVEEACNKLFPGNPASEAITAVCLEYISVSMLAIKSLITDIDEGIAHDVDERAIQIAAEMLEAKAKPLTPQAEPQ